MKIYSNDNITKTDLDAVDAKQAKQIKDLRSWLLASFAFNFLLTTILYFVK
jgi:hypothetical protein